MLGFEHLRRGLRLFLYPDTIAPHSRDLEHDIWPADLYLSLSLRSDVIASFFYSDREEESLTEDENEWGIIGDNRGGYDTEAQYLIPEDRFSVHCTGVWHLLHLVQAFQCILLGSNKKIRNK
jgi:hypothetical protein